MLGPELPGGREPPWRAVLGTSTVLLLALLGYPYGGSESSNAPTAPEGPVAERPHASVPPEGVLWAGCEEVELSPTGEPRGCTLYSDVTRDRATLRVWLPSSAAEPVISLDGAVVEDVDATRVHDGWSLHVVPSHDGHLRVSGTVGGVPSELLSLDIHLRPRPDVELRTQLDDAVGTQPAQQALASRLREALAQEQAPLQRLLITQYLQFVHFDMGDHQGAVDHALEVVRLAKAHGKPLTECDALWVASFILGEDLGDEHAASEVLRSGCPYGASIPSVEMMGAYYGGLRSLRQGSLAGAQRSFQRAVEIARRLRWPRWELQALNPLIETLARQGRFGWARLSLERMRELDVSSHHTGLLGRCDAQSHYHRKLGSLAQREAELVGDSLGLARTHWLDAQAVVLDRSRCPDHPSVHDQAERLAIDLARAATELGELDRAQEILDALPGETVSAHTDVGRRIGRAELALARGDVKAAARILEDFAADRRRGKLAEGTGPEGTGPEGTGPEEDWRLQLAWARVYQQRGELRAALGALAEAQAHIDRSRSTSGSETDRHAAMRRKSSESLVRLLLEHRLPHQALCTARVARARGLASLGPVPEQARGSLEALERSRATLFEGYKWYDPRDIPIDQRLRLDAERHAFEATISDQPAPVECDRLPAASPGEASVLYFDDGGGLLGFAWNADGHLVVRRLSEWSTKDSSERLGEALISPFASVLEGQSRLRVLAPAAMSEVSFAELSWQGQLLGDRLAVAHALDLPVVPRQDRREGSAAMVFSDHQKQLLPEYRRLSGLFEHWLEGLEGQALEVTFLRGPLELREHVSVVDVLAATRGVELALLYGFGAVQPSYYDLLPKHTEPTEYDQEGFGVSGDVLTRSDILLEAGRAPRHVILAHCDSAMVDVYGVSGAIGLAQSYVQAGSEWAVGAVGNVSPKSMEVVVDELLDALGHGSSVDDVAAALQHAKRKLAEQGLPDGALLRLWVL